METQQIKQINKPNEIIKQEKLPDGKSKIVLDMDALKKELGNVNEGIILHDEKRGIKINMESLSKPINELADLAGNAFQFIMSSRNNFKQTPGYVG